MPLRWWQTRGVAGSGRTQPQSRAEQTPPSSHGAGLQIVAATLAVIFVVLFEVGGGRSRLLTFAWTHSAGPVLQTAVHAIFGHGALAGTLLWGIDGGILAALAVGVPYILTFYFILALPHQIVVYALVNSIYIPCVATIAMLGRELGRRRAGAISVGTIALALLVGGAVAHTLPLL